MRKLVMSMVTSVDGYVEGIGGEFFGPEWSSDLDRWTSDMIERFDTLLYGRIAWQKMSEHWPAAEASGELSEPLAALARFMNTSRKIVFSRDVVDTSAWPNSRQATETVTATVERERTAAGRDMVLFGGARFAQTAMRANVIDEIWLLTVPRLLGGGTRLFDNHTINTTMALLECRPMDTGAVLTRFACAPRRR